MKTVIIKSFTAPNVETGELETLPAIPFSEFPQGQRSAGPDKGGNLVWTVIVDD